MSRDPLVCMIFDEETGNAVDAFPYSAPELERRARELRGFPIVTINPSPWVIPNSTRIASWDSGEGR